MIELWRNKSPTTLGKPAEGVIASKFIFPSGRQALTTALQKTGLGRKNRIAIPEWSSQCVIYAVGKIAMPVPLAEVFKYGVPVDAVLFYEQWGWPMPEDVKLRVTERFRSAIIILDRVDSADIDNKMRVQFYPQNTQIDIISLSKLLGLKGGGLAKMNGDYLEFHQNNMDASLAINLWRTEGNVQLLKKLLHIHQNDIEVLPGELKNWLDKNNLNEAIEQEAAQRRRNLSRVMNGPLSSGWPKWMFDAYDKGAAPGILPLFRNSDVGKLEAGKVFIEEHYGIETAIYHFNWSGDPCESKYEICLSFPIHGLITSMDAILQDIIRWWQSR